MEHCYFYDEWRYFNATTPRCSRNAADLNDTRTWSINEDFDCINCPHYVAKSVIPDYTSLIVKACTGQTNSTVEKFCDSFGTYLLESVNRWRNKK